MGTGSFGARLAVFLVVTVFVAALAAVTLWTREQTRRLDEAVTSQANFVLNEAKAALEVQLNLGLALADLPQVDGLLNRARASLPAIQSVAILDESGAVLFSTNAVEVGDAVPQAQTPQTVSGALWSTELNGERVFGVGLTTSFDTSAGAILLRLPSGAMSEPVRHYALTLGIGALLIAVPVALLGWLAALRLARGPRRALAELAEELESLDDSRPTAIHPVDRPGGAPPGSSLGLPLPAFAATVRRRLSRLDEAERDVARLDEMA